MGSGLEMLTTVVGAVRVLSWTLVMVLAGRTVVIVDAGRVMDVV